MTEKGAAEKVAVPTDASANMWRDGLISYGYVGTGFECLLHRPVAPHTRAAWLGASYLDATQAALELMHEAPSCSPQQAAKCLIIQIIQTLARSLTEAGSCASCTVIWIALSGTVIMYNKYILSYFGAQAQPFARVVQCQPAAVLALEVISSSTIVCACVCAT